MISDEACLLVGETLQKKISIFTLFILMYFRQYHTRNKLICKLKTNHHNDVDEAGMQTFINNNFERKSQNPF